MARQQIKTEAKVTNVLIIDAKEIEALIRARYPHIPADARLNPNTDCGLLTDLLLDLRMTWTVQSGDTKDVDIPPDIAALPVVQGETTCGNPRCRALGCRPAPGPDEPRSQTHLPDASKPEGIERRSFLPKDRLSNAEFDDGF